MKSAHVGEAIMMSLCQVADEQNVSLMNRPARAISRTRYKAP